MKSRSVQILLTLQMGLNIVVSYLFLRMIASEFAVSSSKAAFDIAYSVPFLVVSVTGYVFLHGALVKHFSSLIAKEPDKISEDFSSICTALLIVISLASLLFFVFKDKLAFILAPGFSLESQAYLIKLICLLLPLIFTTSFYIYLSALLTAYKLPLAVESGSMFSRIFLVIGFFLFGFNYSLESICISLSVFSFIALLIVFFFTLKLTELKPKLNFNFTEPRVRSFFKQVLAFTVTAVLAQISFASMRSLASYSGEAWVAALSYALAIIGPLSLIIGKPLALAIGPDYIKSLANDNLKTAFLSLRKDFFKAAGLTIILTVLISIFSDEIVSLFFKSGEFSSSAVQLTSHILKVLSLAMPSLVIMWLMLFPLLSFKNQSIAPFVYGIGYGAHIILNFILYKFYKADGLLYAYVLMNYLQMLVAFFFLIKIWKEDAA